MNQANERQWVGIEGRRLVLSHPDKIIFHVPPLSKADLIRYYTQVAPILLPHLKDRPLSLTRFPEGIEGEGFWEKEAPAGRPAWVRTFAHYSEARRAMIHWVVCNDLATLVWLVNLDCVEVHAWASRIDQPESPDYVLFDLDPFPPATFRDVVFLARVIRDLLKKMGLRAYPKTSGATGLHLYLPIDRKYRFDQIRLFAARIAELAMVKLPDLVTPEWRLEKRHGIRIDFTQNIQGKTLAVAYSLRPRPGAPVSCPLTWEEVNDDLDPSAFTLFTMAERIRQHGDLFAPTLSGGQSLDQALIGLGLEG